MEIPLQLQTKTWFNTCFLFSLTPQTCQLKSPDLKYRNKNESVEQCNNEKILHSIELYFVCQVIFRVSNRKRKPITLFSCVCFVIDQFFRFGKLVWESLNSIWWKRKFFNYTKLLYQLAIFKKINIVFVYCIIMSNIQSITSENEKYQEYI